MRRIRVIGRRKGRQIVRYTKTQELRRFVLSGLYSQGIYYGAYISAVEYLNFHYLLAATVAFMSYWVVNFALIRYWTFRSAAPFWRDVFAYGLLHGANQLFGFVGLYILIEYMLYHYLLAQVIMTGVYFCINLFFSRIIFR